MSGLLLDTHVFLWIATDSHRLSPSVKERIISTEGVFVSIASAWELGIKVSLGKLRIHSSISTLFGNSTFELLSLSLTDLDAVTSLPYPSSGHRDPFDRILVTQARSNKLKLITADRAFAEYDVDLELIES